MTASTSCFSMARWRKFCPLLSTYGPRDGGEREGGRGKGDIMVNMEKTLGSRKHEQIKKGILQMRAKI